MTIGMKYPDEIRAQLCAMLAAKNRYTVIMHPLILAALVSFTSLGKSAALQPYLVPFAIFITIVSIARLTLGLTFPRVPAKYQNLWMWIVGVSAIACGLFWGGFSYVVFHMFGWGRESMLMMVTVTAILTLSVTSFSSHLTLGSVFVIASLVPSWPAFLDSSNPVFLVSGSLVYIAVILHHQRSNHHALITLLLAKRSNATALSQLEGVLNSIPGYVAWLDHELTYVGANSRFRANQGLGLIGQQVDHNGTSEFTMLVREFARSGEEVRTIEIRSTFDGPPRWNMVVLRRFLEGDQSRYLLIMIDEHDRKTAEARLDQSAQWLEHSSRLASLGSMAGGIAHEINNPLAIMMGRSEHLRSMLDDQPFPASVARKYLDNIISTGERIGKVTTSLLRFARSEHETAYETENLTEIIDSTLILCKERFLKAGITIELTNPFAQLAVNCHPSELSQVLFALMSNAYDVLEKDPQKRIAITVERRGTAVEIRVTDTGHGVPRELRDKIFEPFFSTKPVGQGTGMSLSVAKSIMMGHGGDLLLDAGVERTSFVMRIPALEAKGQVA